MSTQIQKPQGQQLSPLDTFKKELWSQQTKLKTALPPHISPERFMSVVVTAVSMKPELLALNRDSLFNSCVKCANDGLLPDGREAALVPYKGQVQYQPMIAGVYKKVKNSGELPVLFAEVVCEGEEFKYWIDENGKHIHHVPGLTGDRGDMSKIKLVYGCAKDKFGDVDYEVMTKDEVEKTRSKSRNAQGEVWREWWGQMAKKTVIHRFSKRLPVSSELKEFLQRDINENHDEKMVASSTSKLEELSKRLHSPDVAQIEAQQVEAVVVPNNSFDPEFEKALLEAPDPRHVK